MTSHDELIDTRVRDVLRMKGTLGEKTDVLTATPTTTVYECIDRMAEKDFGSIVVMDDDGIAGIFTERDYMRKIALKGRTSDETEVREVMTPDVATVGTEKPLEECLDLMTELQCRHLPVVDEEGTLDDIISVRDCMRQISEAAKSEALQLRNYVTDQYPV
ncbi:MAG: CBS domain-containing protein [Salinibacter sp.]